MSAARQMIAVRDALRTATMALTKGNPAEIDFIVAQIARKTGSAERTVWNWLDRHTIPATDKLFLWASAVDMDITATSRGAGEGVSHG